MKRNRLIFYAISLLALVNIFITYILMLPVLNVIFDRSLSEAMFILNAFVSHFALMNFIVFLFVLPVSMFIRHLNTIRYFAVILFILLNIVLYIDLKIYQMFKFHINGMIINLLSSEAASDSVSLGIMTYVLPALFFLALIYIELHVSKIIFSFLDNKSNAYRTKIPKYMIIFTFVLIAIDKSIYAYSDLTNNIEFIRNRKLFFLYQPLTIKRTMKKLFDYKIEENDKVVMNVGSSTINYPMNKISYKEPGKKYNYILIVLDSWRFDMLNDSVSPNLSTYSTKFMNFKNHYSGGNATRFGIFTLFYGIYGPYWHQFQDERRSPVLMDLLQEQGYDLRISSSTNLSWPEFRRTAFINIKDTIYDNYNDPNRAVRDSAQVADFMTYLDDIKSPFFSFLFLDAPHAPYYFPDGYEPFKPYFDHLNFLNLNPENIHMAMNRYKNAVHYNDQLIAGILEKIFTTNRKDDTIIIITGDHGEEFLELGGYGHTGNFTKYRTQVPFLFYHPEKSGGEIDRLTSHLDLVPTLMEIQNVENPVSDYSMGLNLLKDNKRNYVVASGWSDCAYIDGEYYIVFPTETYNLKQIEIRDLKNQFVKDHKEVFKQKSTALLGISKDLARFYQ